MHRDCESEIMGLLTHNTDENSLVSRKKNVGSVFSASNISHVFSSTFPIVPQIKSINTCPFRPENRLSRNFPELLHQHDVEIFNFDRDTNPIHLIHLFLPRVVFFVSGTRLDILEVKKKKHRIFVFSFLTAAGETFSVSSQSLPT